MTTIWVNGEQMGQFSDFIEALSFSEAIQKAGGKLTDLEAWHYNDSRMETYEMPQAILSMIQLMGWPDGKEAERALARQGFCLN